MAADLKNRVITHWCYVTTVSLCRMCLGSTTTTILEAPQLDAFSFKHKRYGHVVSFL